MNILPPIVPPSSSSSLGPEAEVSASDTPFVRYLEHLRRRYLRNNRVLLIQTPQFQFETLNVEVAKNRGLYAYPPTGLQCLAKVLTDFPVDVEILDLNYLLLQKIITDNFDPSRWLSLLDDYLQRRDPAIIGVTCLTSYGDVLRPTHPLTSVLRHLREHDQQLVLIGGPTATNEYEEYLQQGLCHAVLPKEGEAKMHYLFSLLFAPEKALPTAGIAYPHQDRGRVVLSTGTTNRLPLQGNLISTYRSLPIERYCTVGSLSPYSRMAGQNKIFSAFQLNRGCRANCKFCDVSKFMGRGVRSYAVSDLLEEITYLAQQRGVRHLEVLDDDFLGNQQGVQELLRGIAVLHQQYGLTWSANNGLIAGSLTPELCTLLRDSGCLGFRIGIESGNPEMIRRLRKPATLDLLLQKGQLLQQFPEMFTGANYILGLFGEETFQQMLDTFHFSQKINLDWSSFSTFQFTSKETALLENLGSTGKVASEFTPSKDNVRGEIVEEEGVVSGPAVFTLSPERVPSPVQVKQVWFTFNLVGNYINNKNLLPGATPADSAQFVAWVDACAVAYPLNPYMPLFSAIGRTLLGDVQGSQKQLLIAQQNVAQSKYWQRRFQQFQLHKVLEHFPTTASLVYETMEELRRPYQQWRQE